MKSRPALNWSPTSEPSPVWTLNCTSAPNGTNLTSLVNNYDHNFWIQELYLTSGFWTSLSFFLCDQEQSYIDFVQIHNFTSQKYEPKVRIALVSALFCDRFLNPESVKNRKTTNLETCYANFQSLSLKFWFRRCDETRRNPNSVTRAGKKYGKARAGDGSTRSQKATLKKCC